MKDDNNNISPPEDEMSEDIVLDSTDEYNEELGSKHKIADIRKKLLEAQKERDSYLAQLQRERADGINLRKSEEEKRSKLKSIIIVDLCEKLLPVLDSFDAAKSNKTAWESVDKNWRIGIDYIQQQLIRVLDEYGVTEDNPIGKPFDPNKHEPHDYREVDNKKEIDTVVEVIQKGYSQNNIVIRPARVVVGVAKKSD